MAQDHCSRHDPPALHRVPPGSETSGQQLLAGGEPGLVGRWACPSPQGSIWGLGSSAPPTPVALPTVTIHRKSSPHVPVPCPRALEPPVVPSRDSVEEFLPLKARVGLPSGTRLCRALVSLRPGTWERRCPARSQGLTGLSPTPAHSDSGFVLGKQKDKAALRPSSKQDRTPLPGLPAGPPFLGEGGVTGRREFPGGGSSHLEPPQSRSQTPLASTCRALPAAAGAGAGRQEVSPLTCSLGPPPLLPARGGHPWLLWRRWRSRVWPLCCPPLEGAGSPPSAPSCVRPLSLP